jgi:hypothetical protein
MSKRTRTGKPSMSARSSAIPFRNIGDSRARQTGFRCWPVLVDEFTNCIGIDSAAVGSVPTNADALRSEISRLVLYALIAMSFPPTAKTRSSSGGLVDRSADIERASFRPVGAADRGKGGP